MDDLIETHLQKMFGKNLNKVFDVTSEELPPVHLRAGWWLL